MSSRILDVRLNNKTSNGEVNIRDEIIKGLSRPAGQKILPQLLLYDDEGLRIFDEITTDVDDYYVFPAEENLLKRHAGDIVRIMHGKEDQPMEGVVLELGAG
jgi:L-histidine Nalpha-methyltransferase / hercynylcysteine S-oxide synthase